MDGLQLGERKVRVSMAKASSLEKYYEKVGQKEKRQPAAIALQVRLQPSILSKQNNVGIHCPGTYQSVFEEVFGSIA